MVYFVKMLASLTMLYLDFIRDLNLVFSIVAIVTFGSIYNNPTALFSQVVFLLLASIVIPLIIIGIQIATRWPYIIFGYKVNSSFNQNPMSTWKLILLRFFILIFSMLFPAFLVILKEKEKEKAKQLLQEGTWDKHKLREAKRRNVFINKIRKAILEYKKTEFSMEIVTQLTIQTSMLFLNYTVSPTTSGMEAVFDEQRTITRLIFSVLWSFKTSVTTYVKIKSVEKDGLLGSKGKCVLAVRAFLCTITRVGCIVLYFAPFFGFFGLLAHWKAEQIKFEPSVKNLTNFTYWNEEAQEIQSVPFTDLYRWDNSTSSGPSYSLYTILSLKWSYLIFLVIIALQSVIMICSKRALSQQFCDGTVTFKIRNVLQSLHIPDFVSDWDVGKGDVQNHKQRWTRTMIEISFMILIQLIFNIILLIPILIAGSIKID